MRPSTPLHSVPFLRLVPFLLVGMLFFSGCTQLQQLAALRQVDFSLQGVQQANLAGVNLDRIQREQDIGPGELIRLGAALRSGSLPLAFTVDVGAKNPADNPTAASSSSSTGPSSSKTARRSAASLTTTP